MMINLICLVNDLIVQPYNITIQIIFTIFAIPKKWIPSSFFFVFDHLLPNLETHQIWSIVLDILLQLPQKRQIYIYYLFWKYKMEYYKEIDKISWNEHGHPDTSFVKKKKSNINKIIFLITRCPEQLARTSTNLRIWS